MSGRYTLAFPEADPADVDRLGGKGAGLARMTQQGLRVPPGFVIGTDACRTFLRDGAVSGALPDGLADEVFARLVDLERGTGKTFGAGPTPLLLSVRSGAPISMPGMMDTILNLGLGRAAAVALAETTGDVRFVADVIGRFHAMYAETVLDALDPGVGIDAIVGAVLPDDDAGEVYDRIWAACEKALRNDCGESVPDDPRQQLLGAIGAVFASWNTRRARTYREFHAIPHDLGTAVVVQSMVFGNLSSDSGSGVVFTRNPVTGEPGLFGEYLAHSQGEDVVAGTRTPDPVTGALAPDLLAELRSTCADLERRQGDVLDIEFTVERAALYFLQVRSAKRTAEAAVRIAADLVEEGTVPAAAGLAMVTVAQVRQVQRPGFDDGDVAAARAGDRLLTTGIGACPGQVSGRLVLDSDRAKEQADAGGAVVLARPVTSPADLHGMIAAQGIVTATGGSTSHAAVVARALGTTCVVGASEIVIDTVARTVTVGGRTLREGADVALDGSSGEFFVGAFATSTPAAATNALAGLLGIAADVSGCSVLARVTLPGDVAPALESGAAGIVTAVDDVLAAAGHIEELAQSLLDGADDTSDSAFDRIAELVATEFEPLLAAAGDVEVGVRAVDLVADETRELPQRTAVSTRHPAFSGPLGSPALVTAQLRGLTRAAAAAGGRGRVHLAVRHLSDPAEAHALRELAAESGTSVTVGAYLTSPRAVDDITGIAVESDVLWLEVHDPQAAVVGLRVAEVPSCPIGLRLSGAVSQDAAAQLYELGFRRFAVDAGETGPLILALGRAAGAGGPSRPT